MEQNVLQWPAQLGQPWRESSAHGACRGVPVRHSSVASWQGQDRAFSHPHPAAHYLLILSIPNHRVTGFANDQWELTSFGGAQLKLSASRLLHAADHFYVRFFQLSGTAAEHHTGSMREQHHPRLQANSGTPDLSWSHSKTGARPAAAGGAAGSPDGPTGGRGGVAAD